ncbi:hypothetical protein [Psychroserpens algicola]|uniref:hypothetical protein n=1 Tax=Psychroserpens algicola TaxID=1719034 RepID=UPI0019549A58|nr:hypothetical protein [Psychroserpens algicola]
MKHLLIIICMCFTALASAQDVKVVKSVINCETGTQKAIEDFNDGRYQVYTFGMMMSSTNDNDFNQFYSAYLTENYNISLIHKGDIVMPDDKCYSDKMKQLLSVKYGKSMLDEVKDDALIAYEKVQQVKNGVCFKSPEEAKRYVLGDWKLKDETTHVTYRFEVTEGEISTQVLLDLDYYNLDEKEVLLFPSNQVIKILEFDGCYNVGIENNEYKFGGIFYDFIFNSNNEFECEGYHFIRVEH